MQAPRLLTKRYHRSSAAEQCRARNQPGQTVGGVAPPPRNRAVSTWCRFPSLYHGPRPEYKTRFHSRGHCPGQHSGQLSAHIVVELQI